jgi:hypothetical protein
VDDLASQSFFTSKDLQSIEAGDRNLTDRELTEVLDVYHVELDQLLPERTHLVIDLDERRVSAGGRQRSVAGGSPTPDRVLASYLSLVYALRHAEPGSEIVLRNADLDVLAQALDLARSVVASRLHALMAEPGIEVRRRSRLLRGRVLVPLAGVVVAATAVGTLLMVQADDTQTVTVEPAGEPSPDFVIANPDGSTTPVYVGDGLRPEDLPDGAIGLGPSTQAYPDGVTVVNGEGQPVPTELPPGEVWLGEPQVAERDDDGNVTQSTLEP